MALIRGVKVHENSRMWAYVEWSDENKNHFIILGGKEFLTENEAKEYSKGFADNSYEWVEPNELKIKRLVKKRDLLKQELIDTEKELSYLRLNYLNE